MNISVIREPELFCMDSMDNYIGTFKTGDYISVVAGDELYEGELSNIGYESIEIETEEDFFEIQIDDIDGIEEL